MSFTSLYPIRRILLKNLLSLSTTLYKLYVKYKNDNDQFHKTNVDENNEHCKRLLFILIKIM